MADFHFIRPEWLFVMPLVFIIIYLLKRLQISNSGWQQVIPAHLAQKLIDGDNHSKQGFSLLIPVLLTLLTLLALAGPAWQKLPQPVYNVQKGAVIIMDMSNSMYATDLSPNRLTRARYKAIDLLEKLNEGDIGLIAYAGDSFTISPLTEDINNIKLLLPALSPQLMPVQGSNPLLALTMANEMLINAGHINGDIYWLTDDVDQYDVKEITNFVSTINHSINILGIGTNTGAPIKMPDGQLLKDDSGAIVLPQLTEGALAAIAKRGRGAYQTLSNNSDDINALVNNAKTQAELKDEKSQFTEGDQFKEAGPYLILLILPLMLGYFRRGNLLAILPCLMFFSHVPESFAQQSAAATDALTTEAQASATPSNSFWQNLWQTQDQQAQEKYNQKQYDAAANQFTEPMWQGSAHYKNGNFEQALKAFQQSDSAEALYNQGNSLAKLQKLDEAIKAYEQALAKNPDLEAAKANKALLEQLKKQQEQQQNQDQSQDQNQDQDQDQNNNQSDENQQGQQNQQDQNNQQQSNDQQADNQQQQNGDQSDEQPENQPSEQEQQNEQSAQEHQDAQQAAEEEQAEQRAEQDAQAQQNDNKNGEQQAAQTAQLTEAEQAAKEEEQKHQQLLKKVTDDPYLLLRNKMQLEYQKRRNQTSGVNKKW